MAGGKPKKEKCLRLGKIFFMCDVIYEPPNAGKKK